MKLLSKEVIETSKKRDNDKLRFETKRLSQLKKRLIDSYHGVKSNYSDDKVKAKAEFDAFVTELNKKKSILLKSLKEYEQEIETKKEIIFGLVARSDELEERVYEIEEREKKLALREAYVGDLEKKLSEKSHELLR